MTTTPRRQLRRGWNYYRRYTKHRIGVHAAATAALTVFGLLASYRRWFVIVAIVAYFLPPVYLYLSGDDLTDPDHSTGTTGERNASTPDAAPPRTVRRVDGIEADPDADADSGDIDSDSDDGDIDSDSDDGGTDSDSDG